jgi:tight adherence protein B
MIAAMSISILLFFIVAAMAIANLLFRQNQSVLKERVKKLQEIPEEIRDELRQVPSERKSLLSTVDIEPMLGRFTNEGYFRNLETDLARADIPLRVSEFIILRFAIAGITGALVCLLVKSILLGGLIFVLMLFAHLPVLWWRKKARVSKFELQLAEFLVLIVNSLRAGQTFMQGCQVAVKESPNPIAAEFKQVIKEINLGLPEADSLENMLKRVPSEDLKIVVSAYVIQKKVGGNLAEILETTAATIRERLKIFGQIKVLTTQGKLSGLIVGGLPFLIGSALSVISPAYFMPLITTTPGYCLVGGALLMQLIGSLLIWKIVDIEV